MFQKKELTTTPRVCLRLKSVRDAKQLTLDQLSRKTNIAVMHLKAIEACDFDALPEGDIYRKHFVRRYAEALGVDADSYLSQFVEEERQVPPSQQEIRERRREMKTLLSNVPATLRRCAAAVAVLVFVSYLGFQVKRIVQPPQLTLLSPVDGMVSQAEEVVVKGATEREARVTVNGEEIQNSEEGTFEQSIVLTPGLNTITVTAQKKHGKQIEETRYIVLRNDQKTES